MTKEEIVTLVKDWIQLLPEYDGKRVDFIGKLLEDVCQWCYRNDPKCQCWNDE